MKKSTIQVVVIDPFKKEIRYENIRNPKVDQNYGAFNEEIYALMSQGPIKVEMVETAPLDTDQATKQDFVLIDEEGLLGDTSKQSFFLVKGAYPYPLAGIGVVTGMDKHGDNIEPSLTVEWFKENVVFYSLAEIRKIFGAMH